MALWAARVQIGTKFENFFPANHLRLAFLAPEIVERIVDGCQPPELTAHALLTSRVALPLGWAAQKQALGFAPRV